LAFATGPQALVKSHRDSSGSRSPAKRRAHDPSLFFFFFERLHCEAIAPKPSTSVDPASAMIWTGRITRIECMASVIGGSMKDTKTIIEQAYSAFNKRDIDGALALMTQDVSWPKASEGSKVVGKEEIRAYWTRQWGEFDPHVEPLAMTEEDGGKTRVRVHQLVKSLQGNILSDSEVLHVFTMDSGLISAMNLGDEADPTARPSAAFVHRS
jgi:hypothetical protein